MCFRYEGRVVARSLSELVEKVVRYEVGEEIYTRCRISTKWFSKFVASVIRRSWPDVPNVRIRAEGNGVEAEYLLRNDIPEVRAFAGVNFETVEAVWDPGLAWLSYLHDLEYAFTSKIEIARCSRSPYYRAALELLLSSDPVGSLDEYGLHIDLMAAAGFVIDKQEVGEVASQLAIDEKVLASRLAEFLHVAANHMSTIDVEPRDQVDAIAVVNGNPDVVESILVFLSPEEFGKLVARPTSIMRPILDVAARGADVILNTYLANLPTMLTAVNTLSLMGTGTIYAVTNWITELKYRYVRPCAGQGEKQEEQVIIKNLRVIRPPMVEPVDTELVDIHGLPATGNVHDALKAILSKTVQDVRLATARD